MSPVPDIEESSSTGMVTTTEPQQLSLPELERAYEEYRKEIMNSESLAQKGEAGQLVLDRIKELGALFESVTNNDVKELSMYMKDSEALAKTAQFASTNAKHIVYDDLGGRLSVDEFIKSSLKYLNPDLGRHDDIPVGTSPAELTERFNSLDWKKLGNKFFSGGKVAVPSYFLYGPLATTRRRMAPRTRTLDDTVSTGAKTAQKVSAADLRDEPEQNTSHMVKSVYGSLMEKDPTGKVNYYKFFVNPNSFGQTIENMFYTSFLVKDGKLRVDVGPDNIPYISKANPGDAGSTNGNDGPIAHRIGSFDYPTWQALIKKYRITESYIPHRATEEDFLSDSDDEAPSHTQADENMEVDE